MRVLVTGGAGYIGSHTVRLLEASGHHPVVLDNLSLGHRSAVPAHVSFHRGDVQDEGLCRHVLESERIEAVIHFAALASVAESVREPLRYQQNNVRGTQRLINAMKQTGVKRMVFSSSCATYGAPKTLPIREDHPQAPVNPYGQSKLDCEKLLAESGLSFAALRYFNAAGAAQDGSLGEDHTPETHLIPRCIAAALGRGAAVTVFGRDWPTPDGTCLRDFVHVEDLARAHLAAFEVLEKTDAPKFFNLGTGLPRSVLEVIRAVEQVSGKKVAIANGPRRDGDPAELYADASLAKSVLKWEPKLPRLEQIIDTAWRWHVANPRGVTAPE